MSDELKARVRLLEFDNAELRRRLEQARGGELAKAAAELRQAFAVRHEGDFSVVVTFLSCRAAGAFARDMAPLVDKVRK